MRFHVTPVLFLSALAVFPVGGCSTSGVPSNHVASSATALSGNASLSVLLSLAALTKRLLNKGDLGEGYPRTPPRRATQDAVAVIGCPALERLGADAATGAGLDFFRKARASFAYSGGGGSEICPRSCAAAAPRRCRRASYW